MKTLIENIKNIKPVDSIDYEQIAWTLKDLIAGLDGYDNNEMYYGGDANYCLTKNELANIKRYIMTYGARPDKAAVCTNEEYKDAFRIEDYV